MSLFAIALITILAAGYILWDYFVTCPDFNNTDIYKDEEL